MFGSIRRKGWQGSVILAVVAILVFSGKRPEFIEPARVVDSATVEYKSASIAGIVGRDSFLIGKT